MFESPPKPIWWLPSFGFFLFLAIEGWMFLDPSHIFQDPGVGRHLRTAESILETGVVPRTDPLTFNHASEPWVDFEWGFEATVGELFRLGGLGLVCAFCFALFAATLISIFRTLLQTGHSLSIVMVVMAFAFLTIQIHFQARPVLFTYLFMALVVEVWNRRTAPLTRDWLILPIVFVAWANLHAGWLGALVFLGLALAGRLLDRITHRIDGDTAPLIPWIGLTLLCFIATALNPWGWRLHEHILHIATSLKSASMWVEYQPPTFSLKEPSMSAITVIFIGGVFVLGRIRRAPFWRWEAIFPVIFFLLEGLKSQRHVILLMIVAAVWAARDLEVILHGTWWPDLRERLKEFQATQRLAAGDAWLMFTAAILFGFVFMHVWPLSRFIHVGDGISPKLLNFMRDHPDRFHRPLTTTWNAGPLLWNLRPDFRVSFDDRGDFYGDATVYEFVDMMNGKAGWQDKLRKGNYDSLLMDRYLPINKQLHVMPEWKPVYSDDRIIVYWKDE